MFKNRKKLASVAILTDIELAKCESWLDEYESSPGKPSKIEKKECKLVWKRLRLLVKIRDIVEG